MPSGRVGGRRQSQAPRLSIAMAGVAEDGERRGNMRQFCCAHMKSIVTVAMMFGMLLCIVLIVVVNMLQYKNMESDKANAAQEAAKACLDVAVIGAGISGSYAAWRMRDRGLRVQLFESTGRIGGRFRTVGFGPRAELGANSYLPQQNPLLRAAIHALRLTPSALHRGQTTYYLRGSHLNATELNSFRLPYHLLAEEKGRAPQQLRRWLLSKTYAKDSNPFTHPLDATTSDGRSLYKQGLWTLLNSVSSREAFNFLYDTAPWRSAMANGNAALLASLHHGHTYDHYMTIAEGMESIPKTLVEQFKNASSSNHVHLWRRLACIKRNDTFGAYLLTLRHTESSKRGIRDIDAHMNVCARHVVLALPPGALSQLQWEEFHNDPLFATHLDSVSPVDALTIYFIYDYNSRWWKGDEPPLTDVITDLPIRRVRYIGCAPDNSTCTFLVASVDSTDVDYFRPLLTPARFIGHSSRLYLSHASSRRLVTDIQRQLARAFRVSRLPQPKAAYVHEWQHMSGAGTHMWRVGTRWDEVAERMLKPHEQHDIYIVGSAFCGGRCQLSAEGALQTVECMLASRENSRRCETLTERHY